MKLKTRILFPMLSIIIVQSLVFIGVVIQAGTFSELKNAPETSLVNTVKTKTAALEEKMGVMSETDELVTSIKGVVTHIEEREKQKISQIILDENLREELVQSCTYFVLSNLRNKGATGCFLFTVDEKSTSLKNGVYLRDLNPSVNSSLNLDVLAEIGSADLFRTMNLTLDTCWASKLQVDKSDEFYYQPIQAAKENPELSDNELGYWSKPFRRVSNDIEVITYSLPLRDETGKVYAIAGIELSCSYLEALLPNSDITVDSNGSFVLSSMNENKERIPRLFTGSYYKAKFSNKDNFSLKSQSDSQMQNVLLNGSDTDDLAYMQEIRLYDTNTPFFEQKWYVGAVVNTNHMYEDSSQLVNSMLLGFVVSILMGLVGAMLISSIVTNPITKLMKQIREAKNNRVDLKRTNINEVDQLSKEITRLNADVLDISSKVSRIIDITNMPLGVCEYNRNKDTAFCTGKLIELLEMDDSAFDGNYLPREVFEHEFAKRRESFIEEESHDDVHCFICKDGTKRWINIRVADDGNSQLCIVVDVTMDIKRQEKLKHDRDYDVLTNLLNRRAFEKRVNHIIKNQECEEAVFSIWDLDNLKYVNDTYGHDMGDKYICHLAEYLMKIENDGCLVARMSGDEFLIFNFDHMKTLDEKCDDIINLHKEFLHSKMMLPDGNGMSVSASGGLAKYPSDSVNYRELKHYADYAMYEAKKHAKGSIRLFERGSYTENYMLVHGVGELNRILDEESVRYMFQPIYDIKTNTIFAYEALMRPVSELLGSPADLIRVATVQSKLDRIEILTWFQSLKVFSQSKSMTGKEKLFINSIPNQCLNPPQMDYLEHNYTSILHRVVVEITEGVQADEKIEATKMEWCRGLGMEVALDDYGAGYSNNDMLVSKHLDYVKIDMFVVQHIDTEPTRQHLVKGLIEYCHDNGIKVIAEGVETKGELDEMIRLGVDYVQGYYLGKPEYIL